MVNAFEVHGEFDAITERTDQFDVASMKAFSDSFAEHVDTAGDPCLPVPWDWLVCSIEILSRITQMDLSNNNFSDSVPVEIGQLKNLKSLDLSHNSLSGRLDRELVKLPLLKNLNLQNNALTGMVPEEIWGSKSKLLNVNLGINKFTELNLTTWAQNVLANNSFNANQQQVSLIASEITNIILPSQDIFERLNPMEVGRTRKNIRDLFFVEKSGVSTRTSVIVGVTSGLLILLMASILAIFLWRMGRRMYDLRQIQQALAKDDVRPPFYKYEELRAATKDFSVGNELGKGAFGAVYKAMLADGSVVAVNRLFPTKQNVADFLREMVLITRIKHRHLVQLKGCCVRDRQRMLVYEYAENKNLAEALWGKERAFDLTWEQRLNICVGIARGLSYLHEELQPKIIHRDIKPQNILLDKDWNAKIADSGLARPVVEDATQMATHVGGTWATSHQSTLRSAFRLYKQNKLMDIIAKGLLTQRNRDEIFSVLKTALSCLQEDPIKRPTMSQVVSMLTGNSEIAIDIVRELKEQQFGYGYNVDVDGRSITQYGQLSRRKRRSCSA